MRTRFQNLLSQQQFSIEANYLHTSLDERHLASRLLEASRFPWWDENIFPYSYRGDDTEVKVSSTLNLFLLYFFEKVLQLFIILQDKVLPISTSDSDSTLSIIRNNL